ncbi:MAG TPA: class I SAM-dependent methyltransferase [Vicinamibacterales bacterium]|nr:class I SAM-dependent methyltransferase [Vicinamibacterales bacterium]
MRRRPEGWEGWDQYAPFYDWENARTIGRRDVRFWRRLAGGTRGRVLELGCGTGRVLLPVARTGVRAVGLDRSAPMLARARRRLRRARLGRAHLVRGDVRALPFAPASFALVIAPYGLLQSIIRDTDLAAVLASVRRVLVPGGLFGVDLVPDLPRWPTYRRRLVLRGRAAGGAAVTLVESVRQDRRRGLTLFEERYTRRRGRRRETRRFLLTFRTRGVRAMARRLERAGFRIDALLGDYRGRPWDPRADVWLILARAC